MAARSSPGGFVVATVTNPGSFMATITHPTGNGYCRDRILRDRSCPISAFVCFVALVIQGVVCILLPIIIYIARQNGHSEEAAS